jgi:hypothetical protein
VGLLLTSLDYPSLVDHTLLVLESIQGSGKAADARTIVDGPLKEFIPHGGKGPIQRLREGNFDLERIKCVMLSHQHFDRKSSANPSPHGYRLIVRLVSFASLGGSS